jgi:ketosteroid isomerase-like protein
MKAFSILLCILIYQGVYAQKDSELLLSINAQMEEAVVKKNIPFLEKHLAEDFVFTHGTGYVDDKASWIKSVSNPNSRFLSRVQDSTAVELHGDIVLAIGKIEIVRKDKDKEVAYGIRYIRVYRKNKNVWQMISHRSTHHWQH